VAQEEHTAERGPRWRFKLLVVLVGIVAAGAVLRATREPPAQTAAAKEGAAGEGRQAHAPPPSGLAPGAEPRTGAQLQSNDPAPPSPQEDTLDAILPFVTEGGMAMILGLLLGMATRAILKLLFVLAILGFVAVQYLAYKQVLTVDWGAFKDFVLNVVPPGADLATIVQQKLPSLGAFGLGWLLGLKRG
jgi:uncharacterized membrane protein (Fun14 family)